MSKPYLPTIESRKRLTFLEDLIAKIERGESVRMSSEVCRNLNYPRHINGHAFQHDEIITHNLVLNSLRDIAGLHLKDLQTEMNRYSAEKEDARFTEWVCLPRKVVSDGAKESLSKIKEDKKDGYKTWTLDYLLEVAGWKVEGGFGDTLIEISAVKTLMTALKSYQTTLTPKVDRGVFIRVNKGAISHSGQDAIQIQLDETCWITCRAEQR
jgi:hypothetical protein